MAPPRAIQGTAHMMVNTPEFTGQVFAFILLADFLLLVSVWIILGGVFTTGHDLTGRPIEISLIRKILTTIILLFVLAYLGLQIVLCARFIPYWTQDGQIGHEQVQAMSIGRDNSGEPIAYWVTTETHRFGVSSEIYANLWVGEHVVFHYRPSDDGLLSIGLDPAFPYGLPSPNASLSASSSPPTSASPPTSPSPTKRH
jgi:hypothetical protein